MSVIRVGKGSSAPLGATVRDDGVNFSVFSREAALIELLLFADADAPQPSRVIALTPEKHRTHHYWHALVEGVGPGQVYAYRAHGPFWPQHGLRFDREKVLLDPYGCAVAIPTRFDRSAATRVGDNAPFAMKSVVTRPSGYDWEGDQPPRRSFGETII